MPVVAQNNSRTLLKKLSALRAILSDDDRILLDTLLQSSNENASFSPNGLVTNHDNSGLPSADRKEEANIHIRFDEEKEMYVWE